MIHILMFLIGTCIGSFVNVIFTRRDWYKGRSRCDNCGYVLKWYDLIPIVSFLSLRGRCRKCKKKIDSSHLVSELMMGAALWVSSLSFEWYGTYYGLLVAVTLAIMAIAAIEDYKEQMVYSVILNGGIFVTLLVKGAFWFSNECYYDMLMLLGTVAGLKLVFLILSVILKGKIGSGDFDVLIMIYVLGGLTGTIRIITYSSIIGCVIYTPFILMKKRDRKDPLPFVPLLLFGTICYLIV